jgi:chromosome partitioning protein
VCIFGGKTIAGYPSFFEHAHSITDLEMVISIVNHKGGTGKTTTTLNLGAALALKGKSVLLVDFDAQASLTYSLGMHDGKPGIGELLLAEASAEDVIVEKEGMHLLPASTSLADVEFSIAKADNEPTYLKTLLDKLPKYDFVFIDCPPSISLLTVNALFASDFVIVPLAMDALSVRGLDLILGTVFTIQKTINPELRVMGAVPVIVDKRKNLSEEIVEYIKANYNIKIFQSHIRASVKASESPSFGKSVIRYAPSSTSAVDYMNLADEFLKVIALDGRRRNS